MAFDNPPDGQEFALNSDFSATDLTFDIVGRLVGLGKHPARAVLEIQD